MPASDRITSRVDPTSPAIRPDDEVDDGKAVGGVAGRTGGLQRNGQHIHIAAQTFVNVCYWYLL